jgi:hypothetical protein
MPKLYEDMFDIMNKKDRNIIQFKNTLNLDCMEFRQNN